MCTSCRFVMRYFCCRYSIAVAVLPELPKRDLYDLGHLHERVLDLCGDFFDHAVLDLVVLFLLKTFVECILHISADVVHAGCKCALRNQTAHCLWNIGSQHLLLHLVFAQEQDDDGCHDAHQNAARIREERNEAQCGHQDREECRYDGINENGHLVDGEQILRIHLDVDI